MSRSFFARLVSALWLACIVASGAARADCQPDPPMAMDLVTCSGNDTDGFEAPLGVNDIEVLVESNALVGAGPLDSALRVREDSLITLNNSARVEAGGPTGGDTGITAGPGSYVFTRNTATILLGSQASNGDPGFTQDGGIGVLLEGGDDQKPGAALRNRGGSDFQNGGIALFGDDTVGVLAGDRAFTVEAGTGLEVGVWNQGQIRLEGDRAIGIDAGSDIDAASPDGSAFRGGIFNEGIILVEGVDPTAIRAQERVTIRNLGAVQVIGVDGTAIEVGADSVVVNDALSASFFGLIGAFDEFTSDTDNVTDTGVAVRFAPADPSAMDAGGEFINLGVVQGAIAVLGSDAADIVENRNTLAGEVQLQGGDDQFSQVWGASTTQRIDAGGGSDTLTLFGEVFTTPDDFIPVDLGFRDNFEKLRIEDGGRYAFSNSTTTAKFDESADLVDGYLRLDGDIDFGGDYTQTSAGTLAVGLRQDGSNDSLDVAGTTTLEAGSTLSVSFDSLDAAGNAYTVLTTGNFAPGSVFGEIVSENFAVLEVVPQYTADSLILNVFERSLGSFGANPNDRAVGAYLDDTTAGATGAYQQALDTLLASSGPVISESLAQLNPESYDAQTSSVLEWGRKQALLLARPPPRCNRFVYPRRRSVKTQAPCGPTGWTPWVVGFGYFGNRSSGDLYKSFESMGGGLVIGADYRLNDRVWLRADVGGGRLDLDIEDDADGQLSSLDLGLASGVRIADGEIHGLFSYGHGWYQTSQELDFLGARSKGKSQSDRYTLEIGGSYRFEWQRVYFEPLLSVNYSKFDAASVEEKGAMGMGVNLDRRSYDVVSTDLGLRVSADLFKYVYVSELLEWADGVWHPELSVSWRELWNDWDRKLTATMVGAPQDVEAFTVQASDSKRGVELGAHVRFQPLHTRATVAIGYDGFVGDRSDIHMVSATVRVPF